LPKKTLETIVQTGNEALVQVKGNQKHLLEECERIAKKHVRKSRSRDLDKGHGRRETRIAEVFSATRSFKKEVKSLWGSWIKSIVRCTRIRSVLDTKTKTRKTSREVSYYACTQQKLSAKTANRIIRGHWFIENKNHYVRDVTMREDASRIRKNPDRFVVMRSFALNIFRTNNESNISVASYENTLSIERILKYKGIL
jgi:predicted transposase YbfD/YdcC